jgi:hypothetical protein
MKKGYISAYQLGALSAYRKFLEIAEGLTGELGCDTDAVFYSAAFQGGFDKFVISHIDDEKKHISDFIMSRTEFLKNPYENEFKSIENAFLEHFGDAYRMDNKLSPVRTFNMFLVDLLTAMHTGSSVVEVFGIPDPNVLEKLLPSHLFVPINNLLSSVQQETILLPGASSIYQREDINRLREILESNNFRKYSDIHMVLDDQDQDSSKAIINITHASNVLQKAAGNLLALKKSSIGLLSVTPKIVDAAFGKLPGAVADVAAKLGMTFVEERRRIVVYSYNHLMMNVMIKNIHRMFLKPDTEDETNDKS